MSKLLTTQEVSEYLRVSERTLLRWRKSGGGPPYIELTPQGRGHTIRYDEDALHRWIDEQTAEAAR